MQKNMYLDSFHTFLLQKIFYKNRTQMLLTRMHSSRMRTVRYRSHLIAGVSARGVSAQGVCLGGCTPPHCGQNS